MPKNRLAGTLGALVLAGLAVVATMSCSDGPESPEALFEEGCRVVIEGRHGAFWDLLTRDQQVDVMKRIDGMRETMKRNAGARNLIEPWQVTYEEFMTLPYPELWGRHTRGAEKVLVGAKIIDKTTDPVTGTDVAITFETKWGQQFRWIMRHEEGRGWRLQGQHAVKTDTSRGEVPEPADGGKK